jgi:hypothetical protein
VRKRESGVNRPLHASAALRLNIRISALSPQIDYWR